MMTIEQNNICVTTRTQTSDKFESSKNLLTTGPNEKNYNDLDTNNWKSTLAQCLAGFPVCFTAISIGLMVSFPTLVIGDLRKYEKLELILLDENAASWFGSLTYLLQPTFSILGALIQPYVGRKYGLILTFIPQLISWCILPFAKSVYILYLAVILFGISAGSMEPPGVAYIGEITQPRIRSLIASFITVAFSIGFLFMFLLGTFFKWRTIAAICAIVPVMAIASYFCVPDSPVWLLSKGRREEAMRALCWLRGWVSPEEVKFEFDLMSHHVETSNYSGVDSRSGRRSSWKQFKDTLSMLSSPAIRKPFYLIAISHFACHGSSLSAMRSYLIEILTSLRIPIEVHVFTFISSILMICGGILCFPIVKCFGKRLTFLFSLIICSLICLILSLYTFCKIEADLIWIPTASILALNFVMTIGPYSVPWMLTSEVFPLKGRSLGTGLVGAAYYVIGFIFSKTYYSLNSIVELPGCFLLYGLCGLISFVYLYYHLPETEGKTLAEIEQYFSAPGKKTKIQLT